MTLLRTRHMTNRVQANKVYNEYIQDKDHVHMNATRWVTLGGFVATIGKAGLARVEEDDKGLWITWIDNRPETLSKQVSVPCILADIGCMAFRLGLNEMALIEDCREIGLNSS
jgi:DNA/RNA-binding protein KIN17